jgi:hypothetical protein
VTAVLLGAGCLVILGGLVLVVGVAVANVCTRGYDVDAAMAAHKERTAAQEPLTILEADPEEAAL